MRWYIRTEPTEHLAERGKEGENGMIMWGSWDSEPINYDLTPEETAALNRKCLGRKKNPCKPNFIRAVEIKKMIKQGKKQIEIIRLLTPKGYGYGERSIKNDHAALLEAWGKKR